MNMRHLATLALLCTSLAAGGAPNDFDGDGKSDFGGYAEASGQWIIQLGDGSLRLFQFGFPGTLPVTGDFDGDGLADYGVYEYAMGNWYLAQSMRGHTNYQFGFQGALPVVADFDGDHASDISCYDPATANWYLLMSSNGFAHVMLEDGGPIPVAGDFDGDGRDNVGSYDPARGHWVLSTNGPDLVRLDFGFDGTLPLVGDFDGDGIDDIGCHKIVSSDDPTPRFWFMLSQYGYMATSAAFTVSQPTVPVQGDYDGDGVEDWGVYVPSHVLWTLPDGTPTNLSGAIHQYAYPIDASVILPGLADKPAPTIEGRWTAPVGNYAVYMTLEPGSTMVLDLEDFDEPFLGLGAVGGSYRVGKHGVVAVSQGTSESGPFVFVGSLVPAPWLPGGAILQGFVYMLGSWSYVEFVR
jgi:hypothetical protein